MHENYIFNLNKSFKIRILRLKYLCSKEIATIHAEKKKMITCPFVAELN
jgi:hypothetical protein